MSDPIELRAIDPDVTQEGDHLILDLETQDVLINLGQHATQDEIEAALLSLPIGVDGMEYQVPKNLGDIVNEM